MKPHTIKNGQFVTRAGKIIPPIFGDRHQIALLKEFQLKADIWDKGIEVKINEYSDNGKTLYYAICKCGFCKDKPATSEYKAKSDLQSFEKVEIECAHCGQSYKIVYRSDINEAKAFEWDFWYNTIKR